MHNKKGMTLLELMVGLFVFSIIIGSIHHIFLNFMGHHQNQEISVQVQEESDRLNYYFEKDIRESNQQFNVNQNGNCFFLKDTAETDSKLQYCLEDNTIYRNKQVLMNNVSEFKIEENTNKIILKLKTSEKVGGQFYEQSYTLRNVE